MESKREIEREEDAYIFSKFMYSITQLVVQGML